MNSSHNNEEQLALINEALQKGLKLVRDGATEKAEQYFRAILDILPNHAQAGYQLGLLARQKNNLSEALDFFEIAVDNNPEHGPYWVAYIDTLAETGQTEEAVKILDIARRAGLSGNDVDSLAIRLTGKTQVSEDHKPEEKQTAKLLSLFEQGKIKECEFLAREILSNFPEDNTSLKVLGAVLKQQNRDGEAVDIMMRAAHLHPNDPEIFNNLGITLENCGQLNESAEVLYRAITLNNNFAEAHNNLGVTLRALGKLKEAENAFKTALQIHPEYSEAWCNLGINLKDQGQLKEAEKALNHALQLNPDYAEAYNNLGNVLHSGGRLKEAEHCFYNALKLNKNFAVAYNNLGNTLHCLGELDQAENCYRSALEIDPAYSEPFDGLLFVSNYNPDKSSEELFSLYREYDRRFGIPLQKTWQPAENERSMNRRLRIGYVSPAFTKHPVFNFLEPLLANHDRSAFELFAYSEAIREDNITDDYKKYFHHWLSTVPFSDEQLANRIREDKIDILIDLAGHTGRNRLGVFARKPAPVSLHWLDFGYTTGLTAIDYYLTDPYCAPFGSEKFFSEKIWRLTVPSFVYRPTENMGPVGELPAAKNGFITFGTLTRAIRINHRTIRLWSRLLDRVKNSRLVIDSGNFRDRQAQNNLLTKFASFGIDKKRIEIGFHSPPWDVLRKIDITLDCFPHNSGTTLFESLYMGIPYITLADRPGVGRIGSSILHGIGHPEWIARSEEEYLDKAVLLTEDINGLEILRKNLRNQMETGHLMDHEGFTGQVENAYRSMFEIWLKKETDSGDGTGVDPEAASHFNKGIDLLQEMQYEPARDLFIQAINIQHNFADAYNNLGVIYQHQEHYDQAEACLSLALQYRPDYADACFNLANTYKIQHDLLSAEKYYRQVLTICPEYHLAHYNLGNILQEQGRIDEAEKFLRKSIRLQPDNINSFSTLLFTLNYHPDIPAEKLFQEYIEFDTRFCLPLREHWYSHANSTQKNRPLKIGYCGADYRKHPARYFILPLLTHHDRQSFHIYSYVPIAEKEKRSDIFFNHVDKWTSTSGMPDDKLAETIRNDEIDILIDLAGHTAGNRLLVFARKPAPISLHWLDYGYTTGLTAIDYYLTDRITVPPGSEHLFSETPWYIDTPAQAYRPPENTGPVGELPALKNNFITFGTLTRAVRINHRTIRVWAEILKALPTSKLIVNSGSYEKVEIQQQLIKQFKTHGIKENRLDIGCDSPPWDVLRRIDICLDCFPHNSGTTLVESLYMGVPYITLAARPGMGRIGGSILHGVNRPEWIAESESDYIRKALLLASNPSALAEIRMNLRETLEKGPMMDEEAFTRKVEKAFRDMFLQWCRDKNQSGQELVTGKRGTKKKKKKGKKRPPSSKLRKLEQLFNSGKQQEAIDLANALIGDYPENGIAWKILGPLLFQRGQTDHAVNIMKHAADLLPSDPDVHFNLAVGLEQSGNLQESRKHYGKVLKLTPGNSQAYYNLSNVLRQLGELDEAVDALKAAMKIRPESAEIYNNLGRIFQKKGDTEKAKSYYLHALNLNPSMAITHYNLGLNLLKSGELANAETHLETALSLSPDFLEARRSMGSLLQKQGRLEESIDCFKKILETHPDDIETLNNLAFTLHRSGADSEAEDLCRRVIDLDPKYVKALNNIGNILLKKGRFNEAEHYLRLSLQLKPDNPRTLGNILFLLNYHPDKTSKDIYDEYKLFNTIFAEPCKKFWFQHTNRSPVGRKLKVGYVGSQFRKHSARYCLEPLLDCHDRDRFELFAYAELFTEDEQTIRYKNLMDHWFITTGFTDDAVVEQIRKDKIDILIDLAGHTEGNRLGVFARKPAPVSLHWLDFGYTTGLTAIDYYLTDEHIVPNGSEKFFSENIWRLANPSLAYRPPHGMGKVSQLPALENGYITFGTLTRAIRLNDRTIRVWAEILKQVTDSRLIIDSGDFSDSKSQQDLKDRFKACGIESNRLTTGFHTPPWDTLRSMDISLDCFPHNSGTTLFETLYMGIPYITLRDRPSVGRLGSAILAGINHLEWAADSEEEYIQKAVTLALDLEQLNKIRSTLRSEMEKSPLMDETGFARKVEDAYFLMFNKWYESRKSGSDDPAGIDNKLQKAEQLYLKGEYDSAGDICFAILEKDPDFPEANYHLGIIATTLEQPDTALPYFEKAVNNDPSRGKYWLAYIDVLDKCGQSESALELLEMAIKAGLTDDTLSVLQNRIQQNINKLPKNNKTNISSEEEKELIALFEQNDFILCERFARKLIKKNPHYPLAHKALGLALHGRNLSDQAIPCLEHALLLTPEDLELYHLLADIFIKKNQFNNARELYRRSLRFHPRAAESYFGIANMEAQLNCPDKAIESYKKVLQLNPDFVDALVNMGNLLQHEGEIARAEECFIKARNLAPQYIAPLFNQANLLREQNRLEEAEKLYKEVLILDKNHLQACSNLGITLQLQNRLREAEEYYEKALAKKPDFLEALINSGACLKEQGRYSEAERQYRKALEIQPDLVLGLSNMGSVLKEQGKIDEAEIFLRRALELNPDFAEAHSNLLFLINYHPDKSPEEIFSDYQRFNDQFNSRNSTLVPVLQVDRCPGKRKLKIGYVSPQFKKHSTLHFLEPLLAHHNREQFEIYAYAELTNEDEYSKRYRSYVDHWVTTVGMDDDTLAQRIRDDEIDVLIDIAGHTAHNRLLMFTRKPAPVSLHWLDFGYTTGLTAIDYYLADEITVPPGTEHLFSERPWRIEAPCFTYRPSDDMGEVGPLPALRNNFITFGTFTRAVRINHQTVAAWAEILRQVKDSRLIIDSNNFRSPEMQNKLKDQFTARDIHPDRLIIGFHTPPWDLMREIDISLDCFPHNSGTTLFETLYMGIPFITLASRPATGRLGSTILTGLGKPEWIADSQEKYIELAVKLASDIPALSLIRSCLRHRMEKSSLMDETGFTAKMEKAYREMFTRWCNSRNKILKNRQSPGKKKTRKKKKRSSREPERNQVPADTMNRLVSSYQLGNMVKGEEMARNLLKKYPADGQLWKILGAIRRQLGDFDEALTAMEKAVTLLPGDFTCLRNTAVILCDLGEYKEAENVCQKALKIAPDHADSYNTLGASLRAQKNYQEAEKAFNRAIQINPDNSEAIVNLALLLNDTGRYEEAEKLFNSALKKNANSAQILCGLSITLLSSGKMEEAETACRKALAIEPNYPAALNSLGSILQGQGRSEEAEAYYRKAIELKPDYLEALHNLGKTLSSQNRISEAVSCYNLVVELNPQHDEAWFNMGNCFSNEGNHDQAKTSYEKGLQAHPDDKKSWLNHGNACKKLGLLTEAEKSYRKALGIDPDYVKAQNNLGNILQEQARFDESEKIFRTILHNNPDSQDALSNLLFLLNYHPDKTAREIYGEYELFDQKFGIPFLPESISHDNSRDKNRRLKIGYVSPQFCGHPVVNFLEPLLAEHNRNNVELYGYSDLFLEDEVTERYKTYFDHWIDTTEMSDDEMAAKIRSDKIDILIDLAGHTERNRLAVFARKPAPVSLHWLDFGYTTGLSAIDYYLSDSTVVPEGSEHLFAETPWRIATPCFVYRPTAGMGEINDLPAEKKGFITFGCLSRAVRINHRTVRVWSEILHQVEGSRLVLNSGSFRDPSMQSRMATQFANHGIAADRLDIGYNSPPWDIFRGIDIGFDCFPHNSGTTLYETLFMGIPFITLADRPSVGRLGSTILEGVGHPEWISHSEEEYIDLAVSLASNQKKLSKIRKKLRPQMEKSILMNEKVFADKMEKAYKQMFIQWCEDHS
jgi:predicted O-linked N-acetylglucosamine transferase (SPINDLY family)